MMNIFCVIDGVLVTPPLSDTLLDGVTRDSLLTLALDAGLTVEERRVSVDELREGLERRKVKEVFGAGTAAVVAPIETIGIDGINYSLEVVGGDEERGDDKSVALVPEAGAGCDPIWPQGGQIRVE